VRVAAGPWRSDPPDRRAPSPGSTPPADAQGDLRPYVNIFVGPANVRGLQGLATAVRAGRNRSASSPRRRRLIRSPRQDCGGGRAGRKRWETRRMARWLTDVARARKLAAAPPAGAVRCRALRPRAARPPNSCRIASRPCSSSAAAAAGRAPPRCASGPRLRRTSVPSRADSRALASRGDCRCRWTQDGPVSTRPVYARQLALPEVGEAGQRRRAARQQGACWSAREDWAHRRALYLAAAGLAADARGRRHGGASNLQRQILHTDCAQASPRSSPVEPRWPRSIPASRWLHCNCDWTKRTSRLSWPGHDVVIDGSDNFATRYLVNEAWRAARRPERARRGVPIRGTGYGVWPGRRESPGPCYRCLYPEPPAPELAPSCAEAGVLGCWPGTIGMLQATEALKLLLGWASRSWSHAALTDALLGRFQRTRRYCAIPSCAGAAGLCSPRPTSRTFRQGGT